MTPQSPAKIYKAQQRGLAQCSQKRLYATFNFEDYNENSRLPFGSLNVLNEETLAPNHTLIRELQNNTSILLIPLTGALQYNLGTNVSVTIVPGEIAFIPAAANAVTLTNPYEDGLINYLYLTFKDAEFLQDTHVRTVNLEERNVLHEFISKDSIRGFMAIFDGRREAIYKLKKPANGLFFFVINGAFEVQGRLLEERDGLALWDTNEADMEALSENAIILVFEVPLVGFTA